MRVSMHFLGLLEDQAGATAVPVELPPDSTYRDLLNALDPLVGHRLASWAWDREKRSFTDKVIVSRNLVDIRSEETPLVDGDDVFALPPIAGG